MLKTLKVALTLIQRYQHSIAFHLRFPEFITHETPTPRETRGWRHLVFILRSTTPLTYQNR